MVPRRGTSQQQCADIALHQYGVDNNFTSFAGMLLQVLPVSDVPKPWRLLVKIDEQQK